jgi:hypothetical protein
MLKNAPSGGHDFAGVVVMPTNDQPLDQQAAGFMF